MRHARSLVGLAVGAILLMPAYVTLRALGMPYLLAGLGAAIIAGGTVWQVALRLPESLVSIARQHPKVLALWLLLTLGAAVQIGRLAVFIGDPTARDQSVLPASDFMTRHSCATAYYEAARVVREEPNVYDPKLYGSPRNPKAVNGFSLDTYEYPPQFLLASRLPFLFTSDFLVYRALWFFIELVFFLAAAIGLGAWLADRAPRALLLIPAVILAVPTRITLQMGNFQIMALSLSVLAMLAFERRRPAVGAAFLSFAIVTKLFPGVLLLYLIVQRRWRDAGWTLAFAAAFTLATLVVFPGPMGAFFSFQLPRLASGDAFPMLKGLPWAVLINHSAFGIAIKLNLFHVPGMSFRVAAFVAWVWTVLVVLAAVVVAKAKLDKLATAQAWLALLGLAAMRSPFLPQEYALIVPVWLFTLVAARAQLRPALIAALCAIWLALNFLVSREDASRGLLFTTIGTTIPQLVSLGLLVGPVLAAWRGRSTDDNHASAQPGPA